jgi:hypothetical protein
MDTIEFMSLLISHFPVRHKTPEAETLWMQSYHRQLKGFTGATREKAANDILLANAKRPQADRHRFPPLADCVKACTEARRWLNEQERGPELRVEEKAAWAQDSSARFSDWRERLADQLIVGEMGRRADKEGWIMALHNFIREHGRLPKPGEITAEQIAGGRQFEATYKAAVLSRRQGLIDIGDKMRETKHRLGAIARGEVRP